MAFDIGTIFGNSESMTKEQFSAALQEKGIKLADLSTGQYVNSDKYQNAVNELDQIKRSSMTDAQKTQADLEAIRKQNAELMKGLRRSKIESAFTKGGISTDGCEGLIDQLANMDDDAAMTNAQGIINAFSAKKQQIETSVRQEMMQNMPKPGNGGTDVPKKFSEMTMQERIELKKNNPELYRAESAKLAKQY